MVIPSSSREKFPSKVAKARSPIIFTGVKPVKSTWHNVCRINNQLFESKIFSEQDGQPAKRSRLSF
jgi:hypothetical protein